MTHFHPFLSFLGGLSDAVRTQCTSGVYPGVVVRAVSANLDAMCCWHLCFCPKLYLTVQKELGQCSQPKLGLVCNNLSSFSLLLHWLHVSLPPATSTKGHYLQGLHFLEKCSKPDVGRAQCMNSL